MHEDIRSYRTVTKTRLYEHEHKHDKQLLYCSIQMKRTIFREVLMPITDWTTNEWFSHVQRWPYSFSKDPYLLWIVDNFELYCWDNACNRWHGKIREVYVHNIQIWYSSYQFFYIYQLYCFAQWYELIFFSILDSGID